MHRVSHPSPTDLPSTRRSWLRNGLFHAAGLGVWLGLPTQAKRAVASSRSPGFGKAKSVIFVYASGGQSQIDTWDPKPQAPAQVRGIFGTTSTSVPGLAFTEHMPRLASVADRMTVVRSMSHEDLDHGSATYLTLTGRYHPIKSSNPDPKPTDFPTLGAVLRRVRPSERFIYDAVHLNGPALVPEQIAPGQNGGFLGRDYEPLVHGDVRRKAELLPGMNPRAELPSNRLHRRRQLQQSLNNVGTRLGNWQHVQDVERLYDRALDVFDSPACREALDLSREPAKIRERYGRHRSGQACLLARRLVEADVPLITVMFNHSNRGQDTSPNNTDEYGWDTHNDIFEALKVHLLPRFDASFSTLLEDLDERGLLDETLVVCMGEFGRAPQVALEPRFKGSTPGRKHWARVYSIALAGAGVARGGVLGASDRIGSEPVTDRYGPWDVAATMFWSLGIDPAKHYEDALGRPFGISTGRPIMKLFS